MKRVLVILPNLDLGGTEVVVMNYFRNLRGVVFDFVVHGEAGFFEEEARALNAKIFRVPTRKADFFGNIAAMRKIYRGAKSSTGYKSSPVEKYNFVIICTEHSFAFIEMALAWACGVKNRAAWSHFSDYQGLSRLRRGLHFFSRPLLGLFTNVRFACSNDAGKWLFGKKKFHVLNNAIDMEKFSFSEETREKIRSELKLGGEKAYGIVGRLAAVKNHAFALEIFAKIAVLDETAVFLIIGDGELRAELCETAARLKISERVIFAGAVSNVHEYYQALDLLLVPSFHEGLGIVAIEAQAASLPVLLSDKIPAEAKISGIAEFKPLSDGADAWAKTAIALAAQKRVPQDLHETGYEIKSAAAKLEKIFAGLE